MKPLDFFTFFAQYQDLIVGGCAGQNEAYCHT